MKTDLEAKLESYDLSGTTFPTAKKALLAEGYTEDEIAIASASHPFDGKKNEPKPPHPDAALYANNPELARERAQTLMDEDHAKSRLESMKAAMLTYAGSNHPFGRFNPISGQGISQGAYILGIPLFRLVFIGIFITAILYGMSFTFHLFPLHYVALFIRFYIALIALLFLIMVIVEGFREIASQKNMSPRRRIFSIASTIFFMALSAYAIIKTIGI